MDEPEVLMPEGQEVETSMTRASGLPAELLEKLADDVKRAHKLAENSTRASTRSSYERAWKLFVRYCDKHGVAPMPAPSELVVLYITELEQRGLAPSTIAVAVAAINHHHRRAGHEQPGRAPLVKEVLSGVRNTRSSQGFVPDQKAALEARHIRLIVDHLDDQRPVLRRDLRQKGLISIRDKALILLLFVCALRSAEAVSLRVRDLSFEEAGLALRLVNTKTDHSGKPYTVTINYGRNPKTCAVLALQDWLEASGIEEGFVFRGILKSRMTDSISKKTVQRIVKRAIEAIGLDPRRFSSHSGRVGHITERLNAGVDLAAIMATTRHKRVETLLGYDRGDRRFGSDVQKELGL